MAITVDADFPGGNIIVEDIDGSRLVVRQDQRDTATWWFWWNFRVRGGAGRTLRVEFAGPRGPVGPNGAVMSTDRRTWRWVGGEHDERHVVCRVPDGADELYLAFSFPYQLADLERFVAAHRDHPEFRSRRLCTTRAGREALLLVMGDPQAARRNVLLSCRHHACESVASYVLEGVMERLLSEDAAALRQTTAFTVVPMVDLDGVEAGDQGKNRAPHDHGRDYLDQPLYPTVRAVKGVVGDLLARHLVLFIDFHCPWISGGGNESFFLVEPPEPWDGRLHQFAAILRETPTGPVPYTGKFDIPYGTAWNVPTSDGISAGAYVRQAGGRDLLTAFALECSYSKTEDPPVTPGSARKFGRGFATAVERFLAAHPAP